MINIYTISSLLAFISMGVLGLFVYIKGRDRLINRLLALLNITIGTWSLFPFLTNMISDDSSALFWVRIIYIAAILCPTLFAHFSFTLLGEKVPIIAFYIFSGLLLVSLPTSFFMKGITRFAFHSTPLPGPLLHVFILFFVVACSWPLTRMFVVYNVSSGQKRNQFKYVFLAFFLAFSAAIIHFSPMYTGLGEPFPHDILLIITMATLSYAVIKYKVLEIDTVVHRTVLWVLTLMILILPLGLVFGFFSNFIFSLPSIILAALITGILLVFLKYYNYLKPRIDHLFRRRKYDYQDILVEMPSRIGSSLDLKLLTVNLFKELKDVLYVRNAVLLTKPPEKDEFTEFSSIGYQNLEQQSLPKEKDLIRSVANNAVKWLAVNHKVLEKEQVEVDPQYAEIKKDALDIFYKNSLELLIPLTIQDRIIGVLGLGKKENLQPYRIKDIELLENIGQQIGITVDNALHHGDIVDKERISEELRLGRDIQTSLLPQISPIIPHLILEGFMQPAKEIGGDYYDFIKLSDKDDLGIVIGDVSGKGVSAGLCMAMAKTAIHIFAKKDISPKVTLNQINKVLNQHMGGEKFMTMLYLIWQVEKSTLKYSSAGHEHILVYRKATDKIERIQSGGTMLGIMPDINSYLEEHNIKLFSSDKIILYTDGVTEAVDNQKKRYGLDRLENTFQKHRDDSAKNIMQAVKEDVYAFMGTFPQADDITLVVLEAKE